MHALHHITCRRHPVVEIITDSLACYVLLHLCAMQSQGISSSGGTGSIPASEPLPVPSGWFNSSPSAGLPPAAAAKLAAIHSVGNSSASTGTSTGNTASSSRNSSSSPVPAPAAQGAVQVVQPGQSSPFGVGPGRDAGPPAHASPSPGGLDSFLNRYVVTSLTVLCFDGSDMSHFFGV